MLFDSMRGIASGRNDCVLYPSTTTAASCSDDWIRLTPRGFKIDKSDNPVNEGGDEYLYVAIRRPDGYVGKPAELGTSVFAMDTGNGSSTIPSIDSGFPVDMMFARAPGSSENWYTGSRLTGTSTVKTNTNEAEDFLNSFVWDSNSGALTGYASSSQGWMWKRHAGFDVVTYKGNATAGRQIPHSLSKTPEMMWVKNRESQESWAVYHKGLNDGTNPEQYWLNLESTNAEGNASNDHWNSTAPTSTHFTVGSGVYMNQNDKDHVAMLFASTDVSKVGFYDGSESNITITTGFQPRFILIKGVGSNSNGRHWILMDSLRGINAGSNTDYLYLENSAAENNGGGEPYVAALSSTGFTLLGGKGDTTSSSRKYIYYAHA